MDYESDENKAPMYLTASAYYKSLFGCKVYKLSLDAGCTCPNRDGTKGMGGCIFCSQTGSGDFIVGHKRPIQEQAENAKKLVLSKLRGRSGKTVGKYIAYFQNFTSTYGNEECLLQKYSEALAVPDVVGLSLATRPDCLTDSMLEKLSLLAKERYLSIELGLQTAFDATAIKINRCYKTEEYDVILQKIHTAIPACHVVTHLILGLPGEDSSMMMQSVRHAISAGTDGIKITVLYVVKGTELANLFKNGQYNCLSMEEYFELVKEALKIIPANVVVHRLTGDPPKRTMIAPLWTADKKHVMNALAHYLSF